MTLDFDRSGIVVVPMDASSVTDACWDFQRSGQDRAVRFVRGSKMASANGVFDQFAAALQFPYYFGENWAAFAECIQDLSWLPASHYVIVVLESEALLTVTDAVLKPFRTVLRDCCKLWPLGFDLDQPWARQPAVFQVMLQTADAHSQALQQLFLPDRSPV